MKAATKNLLMAAVGIIQHAQEINSATGTAAIKGEQVNYDDVCGRLCADLEDLEKTLRSLPVRRRWISVRRIAAAARLVRDDIEILACKVKVAYCRARIAHCKRMIALYERIGAWIEKRRM